MLTTFTFAPLMCKKGQAYQFVVLGDGTAAVRNRDGECIGYVQANEYYPKGFHGWTSPLEKDREFPYLLNSSSSVALKPWRTEEKRIEGIALADAELARKAGDHATTAN